MLAEAHPDVELSDMLMDNCAVMLRCSFDMLQEADAIEQAVPDYQSSWKGMISHESYHNYRCACSAGRQRFSD